MTIHIQQFSSWIGAFFWPFIRISALVISSPIFGSKTISRKTKLSLSVALTLVIMPLLPAPPFIDPLSIESFLLAIQQITIGIAIGLAIQFIVEMFILVGQIVSRQAGLGFAMLIDPQSGVNVPLFSQLYMMAILLIYLSMDGHLMAIQLLTDSFKTWPVGNQFFGKNEIFQWIIWAKWIFISAVKISLPAIISILIVYTGFGILTRAVPQMNIFSIGFNFIILIGFLFLYLSFPTILPHVKNNFNEVFIFIHAVILKGG